MAFPIIAASLVILLFFLYAMKWGMVRLVSGGLALAVGMAAFFSFLNIAPPIIEREIKLDFGWEFNLVGAGVAGVVSYLLSWLIFGFVLKFLFNADSFLHPLVDGIPGGIQSIVASVIFSFFLFTAVRDVGTLHELNYVASIAKPEITDVDFDKLPPPSRFTVWRDQIENVPHLTEWMDLCDPFSRRENRNLGVVSLFAVKEPGRTFSQRSPELGPILENREVWALLNSQDMESKIRLNDRVGLVLDNEANEIAAGSSLNSRLRDLDASKQIDLFLEFVKTHKTPTFPEN